MKKGMVMVLGIVVFSVFITPCAFAGNPLLDALAREGGIKYYSKFENFHKKFSRAVLAGDKKAVKSMIAGDFQWAEDGILERSEVIKRMDEEKFWKELKMAMKKKAKPFTDSECPEEGQCCEISVASHFGVPLMFIFKRDDVGVWFWWALR